MAGNFLMNGDAGFRHCLEIAQWTQAPVMPRIDTSASVLSLSIAPGLDRNNKSSQYIGYGVGRRFPWRWLELALK